MRMGSKSLRLLVALIPVSGCASEPTLRDSVDGFIQQHVSVAIKWLGEPTDQLALTGNPVTWAIWPLSLPTSRHTLSGDFPKFGIGTLYAWSSTGDKSGCLINLYADPKGIVTGAVVSRDSQRCTHYADVLIHAPRKPQSYCGGLRMDPCIE